MENKGMALGIIDGDTITGLGGISIDSTLVFHQELHNLLQPVFEIMEKDFPGYQLILENGSGKIVREETHGIIFHDKKIEEFKSESIQNVLNALLCATQPIIQDFINDIKKE